MSNRLEQLESAKINKSSLTELERQVYAKNQQRQPQAAAGKVEPIVEYIRQNAIARASVHQNPSIEQQQETPSSPPQQQKTSHVGFNFANVTVYPNLHTIKIMKSIHARESKKLVIEDDVSPEDAIQRAR